MKRVLNASFGTGALRSLSWVSAGATGLATLLVGGAALATSAPYRLADLRTDAYAAQVGGTAWGQTFAAELPDGRVVFRGYGDDEGLEVWISDGTSVGTKVLKDVEPGPGDSDPYLFTAFAGRVYFVAQTLAHGLEIWVTDGTELGTALYWEAMPGPASSLVAPDLVPSAGKLYWVADSSTHGRELRVTDGSGAVTTIDLVFGTEGSDAFGLTSLGDGSIAFSAHQAATGREPYVSDGTAVGTELIDDLMPGTDSSVPADFEPLIDGRVAFSALDPAGGFTLAVWDPSLVFGAVSRPGAASPSTLRAIGSDLYFCADSGDGSEPHRWDLTATPPTQVVDLFAGPGDGCVNFQSDFASSANGVVFVGKEASVGLEVFVTGGTQGTTALLADTLPGAADSNPDLVGSDGTTVYYQATDATAQVGLYSTNGSSVTLEGVAPASGNYPTLLTAGGDIWLRPTRTVPQFEYLPAGASTSQVLADFETTAAGASRFARGRVGGEVLWAARSNVGSEPHIVRAAGPPRLLADLDPGPSHSSPTQFAATESWVAMIATGADEAGPILWDGTSVQVLRFDPTPSFNANSRNLGLFRDFFLMGARTSATSSDRFLVAVDPTAGTWQELGPAPFPNITPAWAPAGESVLWSSPANGGELWRWDGAGAGYLVAPGAVPFSGAGAVLRDETGSNDLVYVFALDDAGDGEELFLLNGDGVQMVEDLNPSGDSTPREFLAGPGHRAVFVADLSVNAPELLLVVEDGSLEQLTDFAGTASGLETMAVTDGGWFFAADTPATGREIWFTDGTFAGTHVLDLVPGPGASFVGGAFVGDPLMTTDGTHAYWFAWTPSAGYELWRSDGTLGGTEMLPEIIPGPGGQESTKELAWIDGVLYFQANGADGAGEELWVYNPEGVIFTDGFEVDGTGWWSQTSP